VLRDQAVNGLDGHCACADGAGRGDAAAVERGVDGKGNGARSGAGSGSGDDETVTAGECGELSLTFSERFAE
jgi:hypothetical protein